MLKRLPELSDSDFAACDEILGSSHMLSMRVERLEARRSEMTEFAPDLRRNSSSEFISLSILLLTASKQYGIISFVSK